MRYFGIGMLFMLMVLKPQVGVALFGIFAEGMQTAAAAMAEHNQIKIDPNTSFAPQGVQLEPIVAKTEEEENEIDKIQLGPLAPLPGVTPTKQAKAEISPAKTPKEIAYQEALTKQKILEDFVKYNGTDPVIRRRLDLPPKVPSIEEFEFEDENVSTTVFDKHFDAKFKKK
jgi:hypothetical protein